MNREFLIKPITEIQMDEERKNQGLSELLDPSMGILMVKAASLTPDKLQKLRDVLTHEVFMANIF